MSDTTLNPSATTTLGRPVSRFIAGIAFVTILLTGVGLSGVARASVSAGWTKANASYIDVRVVNHGRSPVRVTSARIADPRVEVTSVSEVSRRLGHAQHAAIRIGIVLHCGRSANGSRQGGVINVRTMLGTTQASAIDGLTTYVAQRCIAPQPSA